LDDEIIFNAIRNLHKNKRLFIQGDRATWYIDEMPRSLEYSFVIFDPKYAPPEELPDQEENGVFAEGDAGQKGESQGTVSPEVERRYKKQLELSGNSPRVILSQIEARTSENDLFQEIKVKYLFNQKISKQDMMKLIKQLPQTEAQIEGEVELWRENED